MKYFILIFLFLFSFSSFGQSSKYKSVKRIYDTLKVKDSLTVFKTTIKSKDVQLSGKEIPENIVMLMIYNRHESILAELPSYVPGKKDIVFFYAGNYETSKYEMYFKFGENLKPIYLKKGEDQMFAMVKILEHDIFGIDSFPGLRAFYELEHIE